ncbi:hypothetical protein Q3G72_006719 [Acer saccharum]|nr:hypothetical protein Q3G72_006719 [Acer saccharum]
MGFHITSSKIQPKRLKGTMASNFTKCFNITSKKLDGIKKGDGASSSHTSFALKSLEKPLESSKWRKNDIDASVTLDSPLKQAEKSVEISKEKEKLGLERFVIELSLMSGDSSIGPEDNVLEGHSLSLPL